MNLVRSLISIFLLALVVLAVAGWIWAGDQTLSRMIGARAVLLICGLSSIGGLVLLWTAKQEQTK